VIRTIDPRQHEIARGAVLRHAEALFEGSLLRYDPDHVAGLSEIVVGEVQEPLSRDYVDLRVDGLEILTRRDGQLVFSMRRFQPGLIAIPVGNRYAPKCVQGGLQNPADLSPNGPVKGGTTVVNLAAGNLAGFVNSLWPPDRPLTSIRVLGTLVDDVARPVSLRRFVPTPEVRQGPPAAGVLVGGAAMEVGKTTFCSALFHALRRAGGDPAYLKATGTACFVSDPLRVQTGNPNTPESWDEDVAIDPGQLRVSDFVDSCGVPSDLSGDAATIAEDTCRFLESRTDETMICELADSLHHRTNLALLRSPRFRARFRSLVYVADPSLDAVQNFVYFVREALDWPEVRIALAGALATDPAHEALRVEILARLRVPCLDPSAEETLLEWAGPGRSRAG
jgi:hypothetical protein